MLKARPYKRSEPRGLKELLKDKVDGVRDFYINDANDCEAKLVACTYDLIDEDEKFCGFFSLSNYLLELDRDKRRDQIMEKKQLPFTPPAALMGQIYIVEKCRKKGYGAEAIYIAIHKCLKLESACRFLVLDVEKGKDYLFDIYRKLGWIRVSGFRKMYLAA